MSEQDRPEIPKDDYDKPVGGGDLPPLELMPDRTWLGARIASVVYRIVVFNNKIQYVTNKEMVENPETGEVTERDVEVIDRDTGEPIPRREFYITFNMHNYELPNGNPRCAWLQIGAALGERAHLPTFLGNLLGWNHEIKTPNEIINAIKGLEVQLQLKNKPRKNKTLPPYQQVIYDAVKIINAADPEPPVTPMTGQDVAPNDGNAAAQPQQLTPEQQANVDAGKGWDE